MLACKYGHVTLKLNLLKWLSIAFGIESLLLTMADQYFLKEQLVLSVSLASFLDTPHSAEKP